MGLPQNWGPALGVLTIRIIAYWGLLWGRLFMETPIKCWPKCWGQESSGLWVHGSRLFSGISFYFPVPSGNGGGIRGLRLSHSIVL